MGGERERGVRKNGDDENFHGDFGIILGDGTRELIIGGFAGDSYINILESLREVIFSCGRN